jgi:hypothetical protein
MVVREEIGWGRVPIIRPKFRKGRTMMSELEVNKCRETDNCAEQSHRANYDASIIRDLTGRVPNDLIELLEKLDNEKAS